MTDKTMTWQWAALMPHPPIIVPEVGRGREREAAITLDGVSRLTERLMRHKPDFLLLLSPHQPYAFGAFFLNGSERLTGSLAPFGAPDAAFDLHTPPDKLKALTEHLAGGGFAVRTGSGRQASDLTRDQGSLVPLYFLERAWKSLPPVLFASPIGLDPESALKLGKTLASFDDGARWGLLASGDLSHRLTPDAPAGYSPAGQRFDTAIVDALSSRDPLPILELSPNDLEAAGECGLRSVMTMLGLCGAMDGSIDVLSYEGPFGVGYCNAVWENPAGR